MSENRAKFQSLRKEVDAAKAQVSRAKKAVKASEKFGSEKQQTRCKENLTASELKLEAAEQELHLFKTENRVTIIDKMNLKRTGTVLATGICIVAGLYLYLRGSDGEIEADPAVDDIAP
jgi:hypothetical protein